MDLNLYEMIDLAHVPEVNRELADKLQKWLDEGGRSIASDYDNMRKKYLETLFLGPILCFIGENKGSLPPKPPMYWFELVQCDAWRWRVIKMEPQDAVCNNQYEILPTDIIERMSESLVDPDRVVTMKRVRSTLLNKTMDLQFVRCSSTHMLGTVKERTPKRDWREWDVEADAELFFDFRNRFPEVVDDFVRDYMTRIEPNLSSSEPTPDPASTDEEAQEETISIEKKTADDKDVNLYWLIALSKIPEFNKLLMLKLEELNDGLFKKEIKTYKAAKLYYYKTLFQHLEGEKIYMQPYWFVLSKFNSSQWGISNITPWPPAHETHKDILPDSLFEMLIDTPVNPKKVNVASVDVQSLEKKLDLRWVRYSSNCVMGKVHENVANCTIRRMVRLFQQMLRTPEVAKFVFDSFKTKMLPVLEKQVEK